MLLRCAVSAAVIVLLGLLLRPRVRLDRALSSRLARVHSVLSSLLRWEASVLSSLLRRRRLAEWFVNHCLNSLPCSIASLVDFCRPRVLIGGFGRWVFGRWLAMMLLRCAVSDAVSFLPLGLISCARVRLDRALSSHLARVASVLSSLLRRGHSPEWFLYHCLNSPQRSKSPGVGGAIKEWKTLGEICC